MRSRRNPYDRTTWAEAYLVAGDALEEETEDSRERAKAVLAQVSHEEIQDVLVSLTRDLTPPRYGAAIGAGSSWNRVRVTVGEPPSLHDEAWSGDESRSYLPPKLASILSAETGRRVRETPVLALMFPYTGLTGNRHDGYYEIVFKKADWMEAVKRNPASDDGPPETDIGPVAASRRRPPRVPRIVAKISREHDMRAPRVVSSARDAVIAFRDYIGDRSTEQYAVIYLDVRNQVVGFADYTEGSLGSVTVNAGDIIRNALLAGAPGFVTAHNHPSGNAEPSDDDFNLWDKIDRLATDMGLVSLDHLVMGRDRYYARREASSIRYPE